MERESFGEDGLPTRALLLKEVSANGSHGGSIMPASDPAVTPLLVFSTLVAGSGSFVLGCATGYSSPAESGIMKDLGLSTAAYSLFGSIVTVGGLIAALINGRVTDLIGRRGGFSEAISVSLKFELVSAKRKQQC